MYFGYQITVRGDIKDVTIIDSTVNFDLITLSTGNLSNIENIYVENCDFTSTYSYFIYADTLGFGDIKNISLINVTSNGASGIIEIYDCDSWSSGGIKHIWVENVDYVDTLLYLETFNVATVTDITMINVTFNKWIIYLSSGSVLDAQGN